jgi:hypothetical protein
MGQFSLEIPRCAATRGDELGRTDLGRRACARIATVVGLRSHRGRLMASDVPLATYRLQLTKDFGFDDAAAIVPYLKDWASRICKRRLFSRLGPEAPQVDPNDIEGADAAPL